MKAKPLLTQIRSELVGKDFKERWDTINKIEKGEIQFYREHIPQKILSLFEDESFKEYLDSIPW